LTAKNDSHEKCTNLLLSIFVVAIVPFTSCKKTLTNSDNTQTGTISTIGIGDPGFVDSPASSAKSLAPYSLAIDAQGKVYVVEQPLGSFGYIRKVATDGSVTTIAGSPDAGLTTFRDGPASTVL
jgi:hypothetical protein